MKSFTMKQYKDAGCQILNGNPMGETIYSGYNGKVCVAKCAYYDNGNCDAYKKMVAIEPASKTTVVVTAPVKEEAVRLGISIKQVRKQRSGNGTVAPVKTASMAVAKKPVPTSKIAPKKTVVRVADSKPTPKTNGTVKSTAPTPKATVIPGKIELKLSKPLPTPKNSGIKIVQVTKTIKAASKK